MVPAHTPTRVVLACKRAQGASLIRIRWYDNKDSELFVERKIHHESWVQEQRYLSVSVFLHVVSKCLLPTIQNRHRRAESYHSGLESLKET